MECPTRDHPCHENENPQSTKDGSNNPAKTDTTLNLLTLPLEIRWNIYDHLSHAFLQKKLKEGRRCFRLDWTSTASNSSTSGGGLGEITSVAATCHQLRAEILPKFFGSVIVKFPAWNEDFKTQCLYWIDSVSENLVGSIDCFWLEGVYWRACVRLGKGEEKGWEEEKARRRDWRQFSGFVEVFGEGYVVRVEFFEHVRNRAEEAAGKLGAVIGKMVDKRERKELGREDLRCLVEGAGLRGWDEG